jgi:hypothetical protein
VRAGEVARLPKRIRALYRDYCLLVGGWYGCPKPSFNMLTPACFINHSDKPNVGCDKHHEFYALRNIRPDEELLVDYGSFSKLYDESPVFGFNLNQKKGGGA